MKKSICLVLMILLLVCMTGCGNNDYDLSVQNDDMHEPSIHWRVDTTGKYLNDENVSSLICVEAVSINSARVLMFEKSELNGKNVWTNTLECDAVIGQNGLGREKEGDSKTPVGDFGIIEAFGIKENPGTKLKYIDVTEDIYCCGDEVAYNQIIDINEYPHDCSNGEHMIEYSPEYNYGFFFDYNKEHVVGLGAALFFHCKGANTYSGGCIAVDEECMIQILKTADEHTRLIIDYAPDYVE